MKNGVHFAFIDRAKRVIGQEGFEKEDKQFALIMDEMKIKSGVVHRKHTGELVEFCDLSTGTNVNFHDSHFYKLCNVPNKTHKTRNPFADHDLYFFCDPPHLLKTARNCLSNSGAHSNTQNLMVSASYPRFRLMGFKWNRGHNV